jgi:hypothetical protein
MESRRTTRTEAQSGERSAARYTSAGRLDQQLCELVEVVWSCERRWTLENRIDAAIRYGRQSRPQGETPCQ